MKRWVLGCAVAMAMTTSVYAEDIRVGPNDDYRDRLMELQPGDRLILAAGSYERGLPIHDLNGTAEQPIVITGPESGEPAIILGRACCNSIAIVDSSYVVIRHLSVDARGEAVDGVKAESVSQFAHHITIEHIHFYNFPEGSQQLVGINTKCPVWDWTIRFNRIDDAGIGIYFGDSNGTAPFVRGLIENNLIVNPIGYAMQIKHQAPRPDIPGMPMGPSVTRIRHNVLMKAERSSMGGNARPNLLVGAFPSQGPGQDDRYEIYGNFIYQNQSGTEPLFQGEGNVAFYDNILVNTFGPGVLIQDLNGVPKAVSVFHNTIHSRGRGIRIMDGDPSFQQVAVANAVFADTPILGGDARDNTTEAFSAASQYLNAPEQPLGTLDMFPQTNMLQGQPVDTTAFQAYTDADRDFNGLPRTGTHRGAYAGSGVNPGWRLSEDIKGETSAPTPVTDAGMPILDEDAGQNGGPRDAGHSEEGMDEAGSCQCHAPSSHKGLSWLVLGLFLGLGFRLKGERV